MSLFLLPPQVIAVPVEIIVQPLQQLKKKLKPKILDLNRKYSHNYNTKYSHNYYTCLVFSAGGKMAQ